MNTFFKSTSILALALLPLLSAPAQTKPAAKPKAPASAQSKPKPKPKAAQPAAAPDAGRPPLPEAAMPEAPPEPPAPKPEEVSPQATIITMDGFCEKPVEGTPCKTVVTKADFERLVNALNPDMNSQSRRQLATAYAQMLVLSASAEKHGIAESPAAHELLQFSRMQALSQLLVRNVQEEAAKVDNAEVEKYYKEHPAEFEQATMRRLFIPKNKPGEKEGPPVTLDAALVKRTADKIRAEAVAGQPFDKLQKEAFVALGVKTEPPPPDAATVTRDQMPEGHSEAFDMKAGEVSKLFDQPSGMYIYKVETKETVPLATATTQIQHMLQEERMQTRMMEITKGTQPQLSNEYFGAPQPEMPGMPPGMRGQMPPGHP
jgi:hypothetical protein